MTHLTKLAFLTFAALSLSACGGDTQAGMDHDDRGGETIADVAMDDAMSHEEMGHGDMAEGIGHTTGVIVSISPDGNEATINHQEIDGVGMGAMTMGFGTLSMVDLSTYSKGDNVSFMVKKGRDNSYRITAICDTDKNGKDCLAALMQHPG